MAANIIKIWEVCCTRRGLLTSKIQPPKPYESMNNNFQVVAFGGGCFWCAEAVFLQLKGVIAVTSGYAGGRMANPTYRAVSAGETGHAEVIQIKYNPAVIPFRKLLEVFFVSHDPTTLNRQGADVGEQYRSIILYTDDNQREEAEAYIKELTEAKKYSKPIVTQVQKLDKFYKAEEYHQDFFAKNPDQGYSQAIITPKVEKVRSEHPELLKSEK